MNIEQEKILPDNPIKKLTHAELMAMQVKVILSEKNMKAAKKALGHEPEPEEAARYFVDSGGADEFRKENGHLLEEAH